MSKIILALESSAVAASAALYSEDRLIAQAFNHTQLTHSQTLLPMVAHLLETAGMTVADVDAFAVAAGPGSFTGVRIGVSAVKGLAFGSEKPCVPVSTLESMAWLFMGQTCRVCALMDARCGQVYTASFAVNGETVTRLSADRAVSAETVAQELSESGERWILTGDGAALCMKKFADTVPNITLAPPHLRQQQAFGVAKAAEVALQNGGGISAAALMPVYLRLPQAERELKQKLKK